VSLTRYRNALIGIVLGFSSPLLIVSRAEAACEGITNAFIYNECLAREGPQKRTRAPRAGRGADPEATVTGRARRGRSVEDGQGITISRRSGRRVKAVIDPWSGVRSGKVQRSKTTRSRSYRRKRRR
jgi:hypothetical protein